MSPNSSAASINRDSLPQVCKNAPKAPECPNAWKISNQRLDIRHRQGTSSDCGISFEKAYVESRIIKEIESFSNSDHHVDLQKVDLLFRFAMKQYYPKSNCWLTGSYAAGVDIHTSDLDYTAKVLELNEGSPFEKLMKIREVFLRIDEFKEVYVQKATTPVLKMIHKTTKVSIDVTIDNDTSKKNTQLLSWYGQLDPRFSLLCKAVKAWASRVGVEGASSGRLNSFSVCLMLINYLQVGAKPAVLPNLQKLIPELNGDFVVEDDNYQRRNLKKEILDRGGFEFNKNKNSLAILFLGFLKYYGNFNFEKNWISVKHGKVMEKRWNENEEPLDGMPENCRFIVVEDPFLKIPRNCAGTVRQRNYLERIQMEFQQEYDRILRRKTIFNMQPCYWSRRIVEEGMERDLQLMHWEREQVTIALNNAPSEEELPWGSPFQGKLFEYRTHPNEFWDMERRNKQKEEKEKDNEKPIPWPVLLQRVDYSFGI